ncbi:type II toxin-antitoxin system HicA family toxin [Streptosporangium sp. NPDC023615]|uniref:type II toxin-antitoxin system HicA family toxin n=1 Tax=Streptosporangium sp. NPDC023615 TaxID=3154794 RepID=UPI00344715E9
MVDLLQRAGFTLARVCGKHHIMRHPDGRATTVFVQEGRDLAPGTLRAILHDAGMTRHPPVLLRPALALRGLLRRRS